MSDAQEKLQQFVELADKGNPLPSVAEQPEVVLYDWQVVETPTGEWFLSGIHLSRGVDERRASTAVVSFKPRTGVAVTASGLGVPPARASHRLRRRRPPGPGRTGTA